MTRTFYELRFWFSWLLFLGPLFMDKTMAAPWGQANVQFYTTRLSFEYPLQFQELPKPQVEATEIKGHYQKLAKLDFRPFLSALQTQKEQLLLNDWLFYEMIKASVEVILSNRGSNEKTLLTWFLISESGFDTRITFREQRIFLCVHTKDEIYEAPLIEDKERTFVNLSALNSQRKDEEGVFLLDFKPRPFGEAFSFSLQYLPKLPALPITHKLPFKYQAEHYELEIAIDQNLVKIMEKYPLVDEREYLKAPMSSLLRESLIPQLRYLLDGKNATESVALLAVFTRSVFKYMEDKDYFGRSKPMIPDELFHYPYSDCEDRSALFFSLIKEILGYRMLVIGFPDHLTIAVAIPDYKGEGINYQGIKYFFCDPTGPANSDEIGRLPEEFIGQKYEVLGQY
jgi:hypothetical protein